MKKTLFILCFCLILVKINGQKQDLEILKTLNAKEWPSWDKSMKAVSFSAYPLGIITPLGLLTHGYLKKDTELVRDGYKSAITIVLAIGVSTGLKYTIRRQRPFDKYPSEVIKRDHTGTFSFPSGHTTAAFASATSLSCTYKKWYVTIPSYAYAGLVGYSRLRLGMHYPSDVLAGALIGIASGLLTWKLDKLLVKKKQVFPQ